MPDESVYESDHVVSPEQAWHALEALRREHEALKVELAGVERERDIYRQQLSELREEIVDMDVRWEQWSRPALRRLDLALGQEAGDP